MKPCNPSAEQMQQNNRANPPHLAPPTHENNTSTVAPPLDIGELVTAVNSASSTSLFPFPLPYPKPQADHHPPSIHPRRLIVKRDGTETKRSLLKLQDALNKALGSTSIQSVAFAPNLGEASSPVSLTIMENLLATRLYNKVGQILSIIPGAKFLHLDTPLVQLDVHSIPTVTGGSEVEDPAVVR